MLTWNVRKRISVINVVKKKKPVTFSNTKKPRRSRGKYLMNSRTLIYWPSIQGFPSILKDVGSYELSAFFISFSFFSFIRKIWTPWQICSKQALPTDKSLKKPASQDISTRQDTRDAQTTYRNWTSLLIIAETCLHRFVLNLRCILIVTIQW